METEFPSFMTKDFMKEILQNGGTETELEIDEIINLEIDKPVPKGNNFVCYIFRVKVKYTKKNGGDSETSLIVKVPITDGGNFHAFIREMGFVQKETKIYTEYFPKVEQLFKQYAVTSNLAKSYKHCVEDVIIMEDLKFKGYKMADRVKQLDYEHCAIALTSLAKFHAASVKLYETEEKLIKEVGREVFYHDDLAEKNKDPLSLMLKKFVEDMKTWPEEHGVKRFINKLEDFSEKAWDIMVEIVTPKDQEFNVLNHGDLWVSNILFKYDESDSESLIDVKLLDLQAPRWASPALDLHYFINGSMQEDVRSNRLDDLLKIYLQELNSFLKQFSSNKRLEEFELKIALNNRIFYGLLISTQLLPIVISDTAADVRDCNVEDFKDSGKSPFAANNKNEKFRKIYSNRLAEIDYNGYF